MKKVLSLLLTVMLVFSFSSAVFADSGATEYNWADVGSAVLDYFGTDGNICKIDEVDALFWVPNYFHIVELTAEDEAENCIGYLVNNDGSAFMLLYYLEMPVPTLDSLMSSYRANGHNTRMVTVNDIPAVYMQDYTSDSVSVSFQTKENKLFQVFFYPASDENYSVIFDLILASFLPADTLIPDEAPAEPVAAPVNPVSGLISK